jgi:hypothetical protein
MYDHIGLKVHDIEASVVSTGQLLRRSARRCAPATRPARALVRQANRPCGCTRREARREGGTHVAFRTTDRASVDRFYAQGSMAAGGITGVLDCAPNTAPTYYPGR